MTTTNIKDLLDSLKIEPLTTQEISELTSATDTISFGSGDFNWNNDTITMGTLTGMATSPTISISSPGATTAGHIYTTTGTNTQWNSPYLINENVRQSGQLHLRGDNADIMINDRSLMEVIGALEDRLNILRPNPELEKEWDQLRDLGEQYRKLEADLKEKSKMWQTLKHMPPPEIP